eukprot:CAMPEP_0197867186 /NCGR_PEP_ID=MMETSP1438-20131217/44619_1 /TAXON_ID=1461541 /ORGANISM="Pterosperma sp., Strain CCMP1384" /LENGTH=89 /DNA_ID=CAMNT_0043485815 /DNA_START=778 /DNA_END=1047 /DNA_ORIENTATION=+
MSSRNKGPGSLLDTPSGSEEDSACVSTRLSLRRVTEEGPREGVQAVEGVAAVGACVEKDASALVPRSNLQGFAAFDCRDSTCATISLVR